jgi:hypothetical protein
MNKKRNKILSSVLALSLLAFLLGGCSQSGDAQTTQYPEDTATAAVTSSVGTASLNTLRAAAQELLSTAADLSGTWTDTTTIEFNGSGISVSGSGAEVSGATVIINDAGTYILTGSLTDGQVVIDAGKDDTVRLVLNA